MAKKSVKKVLSRKKPAPEPVKEPVGEQVYGPKNKMGLTTSGRVIPEYLGMRRSELAKMVKNPNKKTKDQLIEELLQK